MILIFIYIFIGAVAFGFGIVCLCAEVGHIDRYEEFLKLMPVYDWEIIATKRIGFCTRRIIAAKEITVHIETEQKKYLGDKSNKIIEYYSYYTMLLGHYSNNLKVRSLQLLPNPYQYIIDYDDTIRDLSEYFDLYLSKDIDLSLTPLQLAIMKYIGLTPIEYWGSNDGKKVYGVKCNCIIDEKVEEIIREYKAEKNQNANDTIIIKIPVFGIFTV